MIAKAIKGKGFRGALDYDLGKEQGRLIDTNMEGQTPRALAREFGEIRKLRPTLGKAVLHVSLSAAPGEQLSDTTWTDIGQRYLAGMGLQANQFVITRHEDTEHEHIHLVVNRIGFDGKVVSDSHDYRRQEALMREIERDYKLRPVEASRDVLKRAATRGEIEEGLRTGMASTRQRLQHLCDAALKGCGSYTEYAERLEAAGVELVPVTQLGDTRLSGLSYVLGGVMMKGSDLGKGYSPMGLSKRGVSYEEGRDIAAVSRHRERGEARRLVEADRDTAHGQAGERGADGRDPGAIGTGHGSVDGRDAPGIGHGAEGREGGGRENQRADRVRGEGMPGSGNQRAAHGTAPGQRGQATGAQSLRGGSNDRAGIGDTGERILALASAGAHRSQPAGSKAGSGVPGARDRSYEAVQRQIAGMGIGRYEVLLLDPQGQPRQQRDWSDKQLLDSIPWLKRMNARGHDVLIRPSVQGGIVLLNGLKKMDVYKLERGGIPCSAKIQVDEDRFQVWLHLGSAATSGRLRAALAAKLGLPESDPSKFGYLAGFVIHGAEASSDRAKFVLSHEPVKPTSEASARWYALLRETEKVARTEESGKSHSRDKGFSR